MQPYSVKIFYWNIPNRDGHTDKLEVILQFFFETRIASNWQTKGKMYAVQFSVQIIVTQSCQLFFVCFKNV